MSTLPTSALLIHFKDYEQYHQTKGNKRTHLLGIPFVLFSLVGLLSHVVLWTASQDSLFPVDLGVILAIAGGIYAIRVDWKLGIPFLLYGYANYLLARHLSLNTLIAVQVLGWIFQFFGHIVYEKKSPAFFTSLEHLFIGPMWIFAWVTGYYKP
ncbi:MAG: DUF962 domain-containing protein [Proteobacteria bacterium]|nr:DUF962 domain-containing protein [Pseudomonadota bacterium]